MERTGFRTGIRNEPDTSVLEHKRLGVFPKVSRRVGFLRGRTVVGKGLINKNGL